jgi:hypothetical protein
MNNNAHKVISGIARYSFLLVAAALWAAFLIDATFFAIWMAQGEQLVALDIAAYLALLAGAICMLFAFVVSRSSKPGVALGLTGAGLAATIGYWILVNLSWNSELGSGFEALIPGLRFWDSVVYFLGNNPLVLQWLFFLITIDLGSWLAPIALGLAIAAFATRPKDQSSVGPLATSRYPVFTALAITGVVLQSIALVLVAANIDSLIAPTLGLGFSFENFGDLFTNSEWLVSFGVVLVALVISALGQAGVNVWIAGLIASYAREKGYSWALFFWITWLVAGPTHMLIIAVALKRKTPAILAEV